MDREQIRSLILETLAEVAPDADLAQLDPDSTFHDQLGTDSVDFLNLVLALEQKLDLHVPEGDYPRLASLTGAIDCLHPLVQKKAGASAS
ncbi:MAG: acyl carrier protein [Rhodospirillales bacterium]|nr:MAG: acyl carrier protein [Rhodospirillales bacterium]